MRGASLTGGASRSALFNSHDPRITAIGTYIPDKRVPNADKLAAFGLAPDFLQKKLGIFAHAEKASDEDTSDLCVKAFGDLRTITDDSGYRRLLECVSESRTCNCSQIVTSHARSLQLAQARTSRRNNRPRRTDASPSPLIPPRQTARSRQTLRPSKLFC